MKRKSTFRRFWPLELGKPLLQAVGLSALIVVITLSMCPHWPWLLGLILVPLGWFYGCYLMWRNSTCTFDTDTENAAIVLQSGVFKLSEERIPLKLPPKVKFSSGLLGRICNFGNAELSAFGGTVQFHNIEKFQEFKVAINSQGKILPEEKPPLLIIMGAGLLKLARDWGSGLAWLIGAFVTMLAKLAIWFFKQIWSALLDFFARREGIASSSLERLDEYFSSFVPDYTNFVAFCDAVLSNGRCILLPNYAGLDNPKGLCLEGFGPDVTQIYLRILRRARIIVPDVYSPSKWIVSQRISGVDDIKLRISPQAFDQIAPRYRSLKPAQPVRRRKMASGDIARRRPSTQGKESDISQAGLDAAA